MSTNFYATATCDHPCEHCRPEELHIGKRSGGWTFAFEAHDDRGLTTRKAWQAHLRQPGVAITDEYGQRYTPDEFDALRGPDPRTMGAAPGRTAPPRRLERLDGHVGRPALPRPRRLGLLAG